MPGRQTVHLFADHYGTVFFVNFLLPDAATAILGLQCTANVRRSMLQQLMRMGYKKTRQYPATHDAVNRDIIRYIGGDLQSPMPKPTRTGKRVTFAHSL